MRSEKDFLREAERSGTAGFGLESSLILAIISTGDLKGLPESELPTRCSCSLA